jgi:glycosyltransferase involved in cell wall biosynthesis
MNAKVTIGLCVKNGEKVVKTALNSISIQTYPHESMKLIIVDNGSTDRTLAIVTKFAQETDIPTFVTSSKGKGLGETRQIALNHAEGEYILWVDDDLVLMENYVKEQVEFMDKNPKVGATKGTVNKVFSRPFYNIIDFGFVIPSTGSLGQIGAGGSIFRLQALRAISGFDIKIRGAGEDLDVSKRLRAAGWLLASNASAGLYQKYPPTTLKAFWRKGFGYGYGNHYLFHKFNEKAFILQYFPPFALIGGLKMTATIYRITHRKKVLVFFALFSYTKIVQSLGFVRAHLDGYGHT